MRATQGSASRLRVLTSAMLLVSAGLAARGAPAISTPAKTAQEQAVELVTSTGTISGTLLAPAATKRIPVVLIIAGSGPTDRDGNSAALPGHNNCYKLLAEALATEGIASLRYDKRGIGRSVASGMKESDLRFEMYVDDASAWIGQLRSDSRFSTLSVIGHSEGSLIGMLAARAAKADAYVSVSGVARGASSIVRDQLRPQLPPDLWQTSETLLAALEAGKTIDAVPPVLAALYRPSVQPYLISWFKYVPATEIARLTVPVLIIQGTTDIQVTVDEAKALKAAKPNAQLSVVDGMNHVIKAVPADPAKQIASYSDPTLPIVPDVPKTIAAFIRGVQAR